jgi:adenosylhomocysteine nucleosidase
VAGPIGIICALHEELVHLRSDLEGERAEATAGLRFLHGRLDGREVVLVESGMGKVNAAMVATHLASGLGARALVLAGVAGGLDPALDVGDVVVADRTVQHDAGMVADGVTTVYQAGYLPFFKPTDRLGYALAPELRAAVGAHLEGLELPALSHRAGGSGERQRAVLGTVLTGDRYVGCEDTRALLHDELGGLAVEMEGAAVAQVAESHGLPWLVIRALSDLAGRDAKFDFAAFADEAAAVSATVLRRLLAVLDDPGAV